MFLFVNFYYYLEDKFIKIRKMQCAGADIRLHGKAVVKVLRQYFGGFVIHGADEFKQQNESR